MKVIWIPEYRVRFFCQDKNGSTSFSDLLASWGGQTEIWWDHSCRQPSSEAERCKVFSGEARLEFTVIRNTWQRLASLYAMLQRQAEHPHRSGTILHPWFREHIPPLLDALHSDLPFRSFLQYITSQSNQEVDSHWQSQVMHLPLKAGNFRIFRLESLDEALPVLHRFMPEVGFRRMARRNANSASLNDPLWDQESIDLVRRRYRKEIELFGFGAPRLCTAADHVPDEA